MTYWEWFTGRSFLTLALDGGEWSYSRSFRLTLGTHCTWCWVESKAAIDAKETIKIWPCLWFCMAVKFGPDVKGWTLTAGVWEQGAEEDIWTEERWGDMKMEKTA
jgi:hypothetical protein